MMQIANGQLVIERRGRTIVLAVSNATTTYEALLCWHVRPAIAAAVAAGLVTIKLVA